MTQSRRSVSGAARVTGVGLHTGELATVTLRPAPAGHGVVFRRTDHADAAPVAATVDGVIDMDRRTSLGSEDGPIHTVEHILAAVAAFHIDDLLIEVDGPEVPSVGGCAEPFVHALEQAGPVEIGGEAVLHQIKMPFAVTEGDAQYLVAPSKTLRLTVTIEWDHRLIGRQSTCVDVSPERFVSDLAPARTFGFASEAADLEKRGLAKGASDSGAIVLTNDGVSGTELRWPDEFVRHKAVDLLGDLALLNGRLAADIVAFRPSHRGNVSLVRAIKRVVGLRIPPVMGIQEILGVIPHRYPMLLVDRIVEMEEGKRIVGIKNVTMNEPFFQGHFPGHPVMPGVLIIEAMAQAGGMLLMGAVDNPEDKVVYFMSIEGVKFRKPVVPGDQLRFELEMLHFRGRNCRMRGVGFVDGQPVAEAEMMARVVDR